MSTARRRGGLRAPRGAAGLLLILVATLAVAGDSSSSPASPASPGKLDARQSQDVSGSGDASDDARQRPKIQVPRWVEKDTVFIADEEVVRDEDLGSSSHLHGSTVCDVARRATTYQYASSSSLDQEPTTCEVGEDAADQKVVVDSINKQLKEVLPEVETVNFAAAMDGAKVLAANANAKRVNALLDDDTDTFMRNDCKDEDKWVVIELSQVARLSHIELSQYELYSSRVHEFAVYGMHSHPRTLSGSSSNTNGWNFLGKFAARKKKGVQRFSIEGPLGEGADGDEVFDPRERWVRYLLIRFLSHHGGEKVCAINEIGVYGVSAAAELEAQLAELEEDEFAIGGAGVGVGVGVDAGVGMDVDLDVDMDVSGDGGGASVDIDEVDAIPATGDAPVDESGERSVGGEDSHKDTEVVRVASGEKGSRSGSGSAADGARQDVGPAPPGNATAKGATCGAGKGTSRNGTYVAERTVCEGSVDTLAEDGKEEGAVGGRVAVDAGSDGTPSDATTGPIDSGSAASSIAVAPTGQQKPAATATPTPTPTPSASTATLPTTSTTPTASASASASPPPPSPPVQAPDVHIPPSSSTKKGSNLYETLVQELRGTKAQQKAITKSFDALAKNFELLSEELVALTASAGLRNSFEFQERIAVLERQVERVSKLSSAHSNAALGMLAAGMGLVSLQYLESMDSDDAEGAESAENTENTESTRNRNAARERASKRLLPRLARALVALNVVAAAGLVVKGAVSVA